MIHELKCDSKQWPDYKSSLKNNSLRINDRNYAVGDVVVLRLWQDDRFILGETVVKKITHILHDYDFSKMPKNWCILSLKNV